MQADERRHNPVELAHKFLLSLKEAEVMTGIGEKRIKEAVKNGDLRAKMNGRDYHFLPDDLRDWLESLPEYGGIRPARVIVTRPTRRRV